MAKVINVKNGSKQLEPVTGNLDCKPVGHSDNDLCSSETELNTHKYVSLPVGLDTAAFAVHNSENHRSCKCVFKIYLVAWLNSVHVCVKNEEILE